MPSSVKRRKGITTGQLRELLKQDLTGLVTRESFDAFLKQGASRLGTAERANRYFQKARNVAARAKDDYERSRAFAGIAEVTHEASDWSSARDAAEKAEDDCERSQAFAEIAIALAKAGNYSDARDVAEKAEDGYDRSQAFNKIATAMKNCLS